MSGSEGLDADRGRHKSVINGTLGEKLNHMLGELNPEEVHFISKCGKRTALIFLDIPEVHLLPKLAEPFFLAFNAEVDFYPAMRSEGTFLRLRC